VTLSHDSNEIHLTVTDWGTGFDPLETINGEGLGLTSMKERLKAVGGELRIDSDLKRGTTIHAIVPLTLKGRLAAAAE